MQTSRATTGIISFSHIGRISCTSDIIIIIIIAASLVTGLVY
jgi:hypothetical protein